MKPYIRFYTVLILFCFTAFQAFSQSLPVGTPAVEDFYRRAQLEGKWKSLVSFTIRPLTEDPDRL